MWLRDTGVLEKMKYDVQRKAILIPLPKVWKDQPLGLHQLGIIMIVFGVGAISSTLVFFIELRKKIRQSASSGTQSIERSMEDAVKKGKTKEKRNESLVIVTTKE